MPAPDSVQLSGARPQGRVSPGPAAVAATAAAGPGPGTVRDDSAERHGGHESELPG